MPNAMPCKLYDRVEVAPQPSINKAIDRVLQLEGQDGCEHMVLINEKGEHLVTLQGDSKCVHITEEHDQQMKDAGVMVHNHPNDSTLSIEDMICATACGGKQIWAVTATGNKFYGKGFKRMVDEDIHTYNRMAEKLGLYSIMSGIIRHLGSDKANTLLGHMMNVMASQRGLIDYHWELSKETHHEYVGLVQRLRQTSSFIGSELITDSLHTQQVA